jgi:hypothetical protein
MFPVGDADALAKAIEPYVQNRALRENHGRAGRARVLAQFQRETIWTEIAKMYRLMMRWRPPAARRNRPVLYHPLEDDQPTLTPSVE